MDKFKFAPFIFALLQIVAPTTRAAQILFTPAAVLTQQYTDNVFLEHQDTVDDFITSVGVDLTGQALWRTAGLTIHYNPTYNAYWEYNDLNNWRHAAGIDIWKDFSRATRFNISDTYLQANDLVDTLSPTELENIPADIPRQERTEYLTNTAQANLTHNFGADDSFSISINYDTFKELDPLESENTNDNNTLTPAFALLYNINQKWGFDFDTSYAISDYLDQSDRNQFDGNIRLRHLITRALSSYLDYRHTILTYDTDAATDYIIMNPSLGLHYTFPDDAYIDVGIGYYIQQYENNSENDEGVTISTDISKQWTFHRASFGISAQSGYQIDDNADEDNGLNLYYQGRVAAGYQFTPNFSSSIYAAYRFDDYPNNPNDDFGETTTSGIALTWQALQTVNFRLSYDYRTYNTNTWLDEYIENRVQLTIRIVPPNPFRLN